MEFVQRLFGAMFLNVDTYEAIEANPKLTGEAFWVVVMATISAAIPQAAAGKGLLNLILTVMGVSLSWVVMAVMIYLIGTKLMPEGQTDSSVGELLRTTGFAYAPGLFYIIGIVPVLGALGHLFISLWTLVCVIVGIRQALDYESTGRAVLVCLAAWFCALPFNAIGWALRYST